MTKGGVNEVSCRRGDSDFTLQEGGKRYPSPSHAHVWLQLLRVGAVGMGSHPDIPKESYSEENVSLLISLRGEIHIV